MNDELSGSRFWAVETVSQTGTEDSFIVQTCSSKDADYVEKLLHGIHPEYSRIAVSPIKRPPHLTGCYSDPL